jgi:mannose-6-phosphate isomerase-like protein (cupin superfamily)
MFTLFVSALSLAALAEDNLQSRSVIHFPNEKVAAAFATGTPLLVTNNFKVQTGNRTGPGEVEIHEHDTDIFYILEGSATFVTGGKALEPKLIGPGETRARSITGGEERSLTKGDVIVIPKGVPHWFKAVKGHVLYYVVKVTSCT